MGLGGFSFYKGVGGSLVTSSNSAWKDQVSSSVYFTSFWEVVYRSLYGYNQCKSFWNRNAYTKNYTVIILTLLKHNFLCRQTVILICGVCHKYLPGPASPCRKSNGLRWLAFVTPLSLKWDTWITTRPPSPLTCQHGTSGLVLTQGPQ